MPDVAVAFALADSMVIADGALQAGPSPVTVRPPRPDAQARETPRNAIRLKDKFGVYAFKGTDQAHPFLDRWEAKFGRPRMILNNMPDGRGVKYLDITSTLKRQFAAYRSSDQVQIIAIPMLAEGKRYPDVANGAADAFVQQVIAILKDARAKNPDQDVVLRWGGAEMNGPWQSFAIQKNGPRSFVDAYERTARPILDACPWVLIEWNMNWGSNGLGNLEHYFPKALAKDYGKRIIVGVDAYIEDYGRDIVTTRWGLDAFAALARKHKVMLALSETGAGIKHDGHGTGDDIRRFKRWVDWAKRNWDILHHFVWFNIKAPHNNWDTDLTDNSKPLIASYLQEQLK